MLSMGRALMPDPQVLLLDEPSAGLSPALQDEVFINCRRINEAGVSIVMVEQNANRCLQICHRGYVLDQGRNAYTDTGDALLHDPKVIELYLGTLARPGRLSPAPGTAPGREKGAGPAGRPPLVRVRLCGPVGGSIRADACRNSVAASSIWLSSP